MRRRVARATRSLSLVVVLAVVLALAVVGAAFVVPAQAVDDPALLDAVQKVLAEDGSVSDSFGVSVSVSGDTAVIGAPYDDDNGDDSGSAYVFVRTASSWIRQAKLTASDGAAGDRFGLSVALDGDTAVISAPNNGDNGADSGAAYVFARSGSTWTERARLTATDGVAGDYFGLSVAISGDTVVIGAPLDDDNGTNSGSAYVFGRVDDTTWSQQAKLTASDGAAGDYVGASVAVSGDTAVIGAVGDDDNGSDSGSAYVFARSGSAWAQQAKLTASDGAASDSFAISTAISGATAVIGAPYDDDNGSDSGSAYVFVRSGSTWIEQDKLGASDGGAVDYFGDSVALDGDTALIGTDLDDDRGTNSGSAYVFSRSGSAWTQQAKLTASDGAAGDFFGYSVALDGATAVIGAPYDDDNATDSGSAYIYWTDTTAPVVLSDALATYSGSATIGLQAYDDYEVASVGYQLDDEPAVNLPGDSASVICDVPGLHLLAYWADDASGNRSQIYNKAFVSVTLRPEGCLKLGFR